MASGDTLAVFLPQQNEPPAAVYATFDTRNGILVLDFDAALDEVTIFRGLMPRHYTAGAGLNINMSFMATTATSGNVVIGAAFERDNAANNDLDIDSFSTERTATIAAGATSGQVFTGQVVLVGATDLQTVAKGDAFRLRVRRIGSNASDSMTGDLELLAVEIQEA